MHGHPVSDPHDIDANGIYNMRTTRICATSVNGPCGHQFCAMCVVTQWVERTRADGQQAHFECPVCRQRLPGIVDLPHRTLENMPFRDDRRTQRMINGIIEDITAGLDVYEDEVRLFGGEEGRALADEWNDTLSHREQWER